VVEVLIGGVYRNDVVAIPGEERRPVAKQLNVWNVVETKGK
jgi:hypothetical protein